MTPPTSVLEAFDLVDSAPVKLPGGQGVSWGCGHAVIKIEDDLEEAAWRQGILLKLNMEHMQTEVGVRVPKPIATVDGNMLYNEWSATEYVEGKTGPIGLEMYAEMFKAANTFHALLRQVCPTPPTFLGKKRNYRWEIAEAVVWNGEEWKFGSTSRIIPLYQRLIKLQKPLSEELHSTTQMVHGDMVGNVLFAGELGLKPAIIDFAPYWHPLRYGEAMVVIDAILWHQADESLPYRPWMEGGTDDIAVEDWDQLLVRALTFRLLSHDWDVRELEEGRGRHYSKEVQEEMLEELERFKKLIDLIEKKIPR